jgi:hypothetical protein
MNLNRYKNKLDIKIMIMQRFLIIIFLVLSPITLANSDDIREFEIEGISIGDSLLDYYSQSEINEALTNATYYKNKKFVEIFLSYKKDEFDKLQVAFLTKDKFYKIEKIMMIKNFSNQIEKCKEYKENFIKNSSEFLNLTDRMDANQTALADPTGNSFKYISTYFYPLGGFFNFTCSDYGKEIYDKNGWEDSFAVSVGSQKMLEYLQSDEAY